MENKPQEFRYTYSAKQQQEIKRIRERYAPTEENKMEQLRKLDESTQRPGTIAPLAVGVIGSLLFGLGMACVTEWQNVFWLGLGLGVVGMVGIAAAYPLYTKMVKRQREKLAPQILQLAEELMQK